MNIYIDEGIKSHTFVEKISKQEVYQRSVRKFSDMSNQVHHRSAHSMQFGPANYLSASSYGAKYSLLLISENYSTDK